MMIRNFNIDEDATITLDLNELVCITNALFELSRLGDVEKDSNFDTIRAKFIEITSLVNYGDIPVFELNNMAKIMLKRG